MFCGLVIFIKHFDPINIRRPWTSEIAMFCSEVIMTNQEALATHLISYLFQQGLACFNSWLLFFALTAFLMYVGLKKCFLMEIMGYYWTRLRISGTGFRCSQQLNWWCYLTSIFMLTSFVYVNNGFIQGSCKQIVDAYSWI